MEHPGEIDMNKVDAQQARRVLDRLVGYKVSPVLWKTIYYGLSAGRVQSVALRLICEREDEIDAFVPEEYWTIDAVFVDGRRRRDRGAARADRRQEGRASRTATRRTAIVEALEGKDVPGQRASKQRTRKVNPLPPFITSTLQRDAANRLRFTSKKTMVLAQQLYEGLPIGGENVGLITYMRTDSTRMAGEAVDEAREHIARRFGKDYLADKPSALQGEEGRAGRARGDPAHVDRAHARVAQVRSDDRPVQALRAHLAPVRRDADGAGRLREHDT